MQVIAVLIYKATDILGINKSPSEILCGRKFRSNLPMVDVHKKDAEAEIEKMSENVIICHQLAKNYHPYQLAVGFYTKIILIVAK